MIKSISFLKSTLVLSTILCVQVSVSCQQGTREVVDKVIRDTTINISNAYSTLFVDSMAVENFIKTEGQTDEVASFLRNFYNSRNYSFAWFDEDGLTTHAEGFWNAHKSVVAQQSDSSIFKKELHQIIDTLLSNDSSYLPTQQKLIEAELRFTKHFFEYVQFAYGGKVDPKAVQWHIPRRKLTPLALIDSFLKNDSGEWKPLSKSYRSLQKVLFEYKEMEQQGGWPQLPLNNATVKPGQSNSTIVQVKKRLQLSGDYTEADTSKQYSKALLPIIKKLQSAFGQKQTGIIDKSLIKQLNVSVEDRIKQILVNLERMKWMPPEPAKYLLANIPEYRLHVVEEGKDVLAMNIVVGKAANRSVIFADELKYIVFSPYWNIPKSIVRNEIYPAMKKSSSYLHRNNMEVTGYSGGLPIVRQLPGKSNALGNVKFIFPNSYNIYFHDTPSRSLFNREKRAFSHGCIRLHQPFDLAALLLKDSDFWTDSKIRAAMNSAKEKWVTLKTPIPVFITYFTSWVDADGTLHFAEDIYGHDKNLGKHLFN